MKPLAKSLTRVTLFSKLLALVLILAFIGVAFFAGIAFDQVYVTPLSSITPTPTPTVSAQNTCQTDFDCTFTNVDLSAMCCPNTICQNNASATTVTVNKDWLMQQKQSACGTNHVCPMIMAVCIKQITQENAHYQAKCVKYVCQKIRI